MIAQVILLAATLVAFYILIGYPLLLALWKWPIAPSIRKTPGFRARVSVIIAVHNGARFIRSKLESIRALDYPSELLSVIVVADGCTDETASIVEEFRAAGVSLIPVPRGGKAAALNAALPHATGDVILFTDVRQPLETDALSHLVANFADPAVGAVTGELQILNPEQGEQSDLDLYWRYELWARNQHSRIDSLFNTTGCIYAIRRELMEPIPVDTLTDDAVIPLRAFFRGYRVIFDPEAVAYDYPTVSGGEFRRRLRTLAGLWQVYARLPRLFSSSNRMRFHFLSHKFGRLVLPWALLAIWAATIALPPSSTRTFLLADELLLMALAAFDSLFPTGFILKRISSPARTFVAMNMAALFAVIVFLVPANRLWNPTRVQNLASGNDRS